ncbi:LysR family transcriptional regulator [Paenibacillus durus ATCC 35681]|uniref:LysR family transcriptional regulator n=2 Tax=Paenibacillus durus TaxID=44251 RepID=A0A0F7CGV2_PAEDU|nr:LysR family transcriptional regulator [Paenibacillus durus ATCC 35681]
MQSDINKMNITHRRHIKTGMNNAQLQLIVKIADTGSFTRAGQELNMTQPAVSRAISSLETELGVVLFIRNRRNGAMLTDIGKRILRIFREILQGFEKVDQEIAKEKGLEVGAIRIGAFPVASAHFIPKIIRCITEKYPNIEFSIHEGTIAEIKEWLETRFIDVGLLIPPVHELETFPLYREKMFAVLRDDHPLFKQSVIRVQDLQDEPMIICRAGFEPPVIDWFNKAGVNPLEKFVVYNYNTGLNMVQEGLGMAIMSELSLFNLPPNVGVREIEPQGYRDIHIAVHSLEESSIAVKLFIETALQLFA